MADEQLRQIKTGKVKEIKPKKTDKITKVIPTKRSIRGSIHSGKFIPITIAANPKIITTAAWPTIYHKPSINASFL